MFLIQSYDDQKAYIVDNDDIKCNGKQVHEIMESDEVLFKIGKKQHEGKVIDYSSNQKYLKMEMKTFNRTSESKCKKSNGAKILRSKRKPVPKRSWSPSDSPSPKTSKILETKMEKGGKNKDLQKKKLADKPADSPSLSDSSYISEESDGDRKTLSAESQCDASPTKDELKLQIALLQAEKKKHESIQKESRKSSSNTDVLVDKNSNNLNKSESKALNVPTNKIGKKSVNKLSPIVSPGCDDDEENANSAHLFPAEFDGGKMTNIGNNVYCRSVIYDSATGASKKATHFARRLLEGVFTHESLMNCTLTGQAPRGKDTKSDVQITPLNKRGKDAILNFDIRYATARNWPKQESSIILKEMGQRITEYKRNHKRDTTKATKKDE